MSSHRCKLCGGPLDTSFKCLLCKKYDKDLIRQFSIDAEFTMLDTVVENPIVNL